MYYSETKRRSILVASQPGKERDLLKVFIAKAFGQLIKVVDANTKQEAINKTHKQNFDVIIADPSIEGFSSLDFIYNTQKQNTINHTAYIFLDSEDKISADKNRFKKQWSLPKPINYFKLLDILSNHLGLQEIEQYKAAEFIEDALDSASCFVSKVLFCNCEISAAKLIDEGEAGTKHPAIILQGNLLYKDAIYAFSYEPELLEKLNQSIGQDERFSEKVVAKAATKIILGYITVIAHTILSQNEMPISLRYVTDVSNSPFSQKRAIHFIVKSPYGNLHFYVY